MSDDDDQMIYSGFDLFVYNALWWNTPGALYKYSPFVGGYNRDDILNQNPRAQLLIQLNQKCITLDSQEMRTGAPFKITHPKVIEENYKRELRFNEWSTFDDLWVTYSRAYVEFMVPRSDYTLGLIHTWASKYPHWAIVMFDPQTGQTMKNTTADEVWIDLNTNGRYALFDAKMHPNEFHEEGAGWARKVPDMIIFEIVNRKVEVDKSNSNLWVQPLTRTVRGVIARKHVQDINPPTTDMVVTDGAAATTEFFSQILDSLSPIPNNTFTNP